jgi:hypothetical protein
MNVLEEPTAPIIWAKDQKMNAAGFSETSITAYQNTLHHIPENSGVPTAVVRVRSKLGHVGLVEDEVILGQVFFEYFVSPANSHSTNFSVLIYHPGLVQ